MEFHAAATLFPMMENTAIKELAEDIAKNGQIEPILTVNGKIIDGRNRFEACKLAGVEPVFEEYLGDTSDEGLLKLSLSLNMKRRHLDASQKAMLAVTILPLLEKEAKQRKIDALKNLRKKPPEKCEKSITSDEDSENTIIEPGETGLVATDEPGSVLEEDQQGKKNKAKRATDEVGAIVGVNGRYVQEAKRVAEKDKDLVARVISQEITLCEARRILTERAKQQEDFLMAPKVAKLELTIPVKAHMMRSDLLEILRQSETDHPEDIEIYTKAGGTKPSLQIVQKVVKG